MTQDAINQRLKILVDALGMNVRSFSIKLGVSDSTARNYIDRGSKPPADFIATVVASIERINPAWLLLGKGEMFLTSTPELQLVDAKRPEDASALERENAALRKEIEMLWNVIAGKDALIETKDAVIAAKEEVLAVLRKGA